MLMGLTGDGGIKREAILIGRECFRQNVRPGEARILQDQGSAPGFRPGDGMPGLRIHYRLGENSQHMLAHAGARATEVLKAAGAVSVAPTLTSGVSSGHIMGTARMGEDPERSVTNAWGRCHDVKNLCIADSSLFD